MDVSRELTQTKASTARPSACLIVMCGKPCSGKSSVVSKLSERLRAPAPDGANAEVTIVDEASVNAGARNEAYENAAKEKMTRGALRSACDRILHAQGPCVILDSLNAIKGFRYELWCAARAAAARYCVVYVDASDERVAQMNDEAGESAYDETILRDLCFRFEHPIANNRWDSPLFTFRPGLDAPGHEADLYDALCAHVRGDSSNTTKQARTLVPNKATQNSPLSGTNFRYEMDRAAQDVVETIMSAQQSNGGSCCSVYGFGEGMPTLRCARVLTLAELRRRKRDFLQLASKSLKTTTHEGVKRLFIDELQRGLAA